MLCTDRHGFILPLEIVDPLKFYSKVLVQWWAHNLDKWDDAFVREVITNGEDIRDEIFIAREVVVALIGTIDRECKSSHERWVEYHSLVHKSSLSGAHPECRRCNGTGITPCGKKGVYNEEFCSCLNGDYYWVLASGRWIVIYNKPSRYKSVVHK